MRAWEILEKEPNERNSRYGRKMGMKGHIDKLEKFIEEVYECGFEEGYEKAQDESDSYGERGSYRRSMR